MESAVKNSGRPLGRDASQSRTGLLGGGTVFAGKIVSISIRGKSCPAVCPLTSEISVLSRVGFRRASVRFSLDKEVLSRAVDTPSEGMRLSPERGFREEAQSLMGSWGTFPFSGLQQS